ncbi:MAG: type III PLP-dependent enzyme [Gammaproteobacteria bacterium]|nr:type III PLP-dependent enzyme [Gammaproteobacteria bacterium]
MNATTAHSLERYRSFPGVPELLSALAPAKPVYCIYPDVYRATAREFVDTFPGRVLYAVKANARPAVIRLLYEGGVRHFDCASLPEIATVREACPDAECYFMVPVRLRGAAREAQTRFGVRHFMIDHASGLPPLAAEIDMQSSVVFARMAVHHVAALQDLSSKFGAAPEHIPGLLEAIAARGAEPALAFNVGSAVTSPDAYRYSIGAAADVLAELPFRVRLVDIGGGFAKPYPGFAVPPLGEYFAAVAAARKDLPLAEGGELLVEPGRALAAPGLAAVVEVLLRKEQRLYLNDGMYGIFWELRFKGHDRYPVRCYRHGRPIAGATARFRLYGPTCDGTDVLPGEAELPADIAAGDHLEFGAIGAYSLSGRTDFNGHYSDEIVFIEGAATPPG